MAREVLIEVPGTMKKPEHRPRLSLDRETVAHMQPDALIGVAGGAVQGPTTITPALLSRLYPNLCRGGHQ